MSDVSIDGMLEVCRTGSALERESAASALGRLGRGDPARAGAALTAMLSDPDELCRCAAAEALGTLGYTPALAAVAERLQRDPAPVVRASAAEVLGDFEDAGARAALEAALGDPDFAVRGYAAASLSLCCGPEILPVLSARSAVETSPDVQVEIAGARYRLGAEGALAALLALVDGAGEELGPRVLNVIEDVVERRPPPSLAADAGAVHAAVSRLAGRAPLLLDGHARRIAARLAETLDRPELMTTDGGRGEAPPA